MDFHYVNPYNAVNKSFDYRLALYLTKAYFGKNTKDEPQQSRRKA